MTPSRQQIRCQKSARVQGRRNTAVIQLLTADIPIAFEPGHELTSATICPQLGTLRVHRGGCGRGTGLAKRTGAQPSWIERLDRLADELAKTRVLPEKAMRKVFWQMMGALRCSGAARAEPHWNSWKQRRSVRGSWCSITK